MIVHRERGLRMMTRTSSLSVNSLGVHQLRCLRAAAVVVRWSCCLCPLENATWWDTIVDIFDLLFFEKPVLGAIIAGGILLMVVVVCCLPDPEDSMMEGNENAGYATAKQRAARMAAAQSKGQSSSVARGDTDGLRAR